MITPPYLGCAYYPEDWDDSELENDAAKMREAGINVARIGEFAWSRMETTDGVFTFQWLHRVIDTLARYGIATVLGTPTATPPSWLGRKFPDIFMEMENGRRSQHGGRRHCCSNNPRYRRYCARIVEKMAQEFADDPNVIGWQIDNEIYSWGGGCFCPICQEKFHRRLESEFGSIEELNKRWNLTLFSQEYSDFDMIPAPRDAWVNPHHQQEWYTFQHDSNIEFVTMQAEILHKYVKVPIGTDCMPVNGANMVKLHEKLDLVQYNHYNDADKEWQCCFWFDFMRNIKDRPFWNTETTTCWNGSVNIRQTLKPDGFCYANSWLPIAFGGEANMYWLWRTHWAGHELMHGSVISASGRPMHTFAEVQKTAADFKKAADFINSTKVVTPVAMHFPSHAWTMFKTQSIVLDFDYPTFIRDYIYRPMLDACCRTDVIESSHDLAQYKLIVTPFVMSLEDDELGARIRKWVEDGGVWICGPLTDVRTHDGARFKNRPFGMLEEFLGVHWDFSAPDREDALKCQWKDGSEFRGKMWYELCEADADAFATISSSPHSGLLGKAVLTRKKIGKGCVFLLGTIPQPETMSKIFALASDEAGVKRYIGDGNSFAVIPREGNGISGLILAEYAGKGGSFQLDKPMTDILTGENLDGKITVSPYQIRILK